MQIIYLPKADSDLSFWIKTGNKPVIKKIAQLTRAIIKSPFDGIGKPEPLKHQLAGKWSSRIDRENRLVYAVETNILYIYSAKGHYK